MVYRRYLLIQRTPIRLTGSLYMPLGMISKEEVKIPLYVIRLVSLSALIKGTQCIASITLQVSPSQGTPKFTSLGIISLK